MSELTNFKMIDENTRIVLKFYLPALDHVFALQRKKWYGWKTICWTYPTSHENYESVPTFLFWKEKEESPNQKQIGQSLLNSETNEL